MSRIVICIELKWSWENGTLHLLRQAVETQYLFFPTGFGRSKISLFPIFIFNVCLRSKLWQVPFLCTLTFLSLFSVTLNPHLTFIIFPIFFFMVLFVLISLNIFLKNFKHLVWLCFYYLQLIFSCLQFINSGKKSKINNLRVLSWNSSRLLLKRHFLLLTYPYNFITL